MPTLSFPDVKTRFERDGFVLFPEPIVPAELVARAAAAMDMVRAGHNDTGLPHCGSYGDPTAEDRLVKIENPQRASKDILELISHPRIGELAAAATGATMVQAWWVQLLYKPSTAADNFGTDIGWHQDRSYWNDWAEGSELFTAWVALTDVDHESGPMIFARGSNNWKGAAGGDFFRQNLETAKLSIAVPEGEAWEEVEAILPPGGFSLHDELTFHGSGPNISGRPRRSFAIHMRTQNSRRAAGITGGLTGFIDDPTVCPVIFGTRDAHSGA